jgi:zinc and cadmium transporter
LVSFAVGTLLGVALLDLLPESLESLKPTMAFGTLLVAILAFFTFEKYLLWRHCHHDHCDLHRSAAPLILIGDAFHNFIDGAVIAAATYISVPLGVTTALAVATHEIPQEVGDFAILLGAGYSRVKALWLNVLSGLSAVAGVLVAGVMVDRAPLLLPYFLPVAAASFLYVAMSDLIPSLHRGPFERGAVRPVALVLAGILVVVLL